MAPSGLPTGTVSSDRERVETFPKDDEPTNDARVAELEHENAVLRAALEKERKERQELIDRYERLLAKKEAAENRQRTAEAPTEGEESVDDDTIVTRLTDALGR
jgi:hypothetical protein